METYKGVVALFGRICLSAFFFWSASSIILNWEQALSSTEIASMPFRALFLLGLAVVQFLGAVSLLFGYGARAAALLLIAFIVPAELLFHDPMNAETFLQTLAVSGGLLQVVAFGPGCYSVGGIRVRQGCVVDDEEEHRFLL